MPIEPGRKIQAKRGLLGHRGCMIFDDRFLPFIGVGIELVQPFHDDPLAVLGITREHVVDVQLPLAGFYG